MSKKTGILMAIFMLIGILLTGCGGGDKKAAAP